MHMYVYILWCEYLRVYVWYVWCAALPECTHRVNRTNIHLMEVQHMLYLVAAIGTHLG